MPQASSFLEPFMQLWLLTNDHSCILTFLLAKGLSIKACKLGELSGDALKKFVLKN